MKNSTNWRAIITVITIVIALSGAVTFLITWNTGQDAGASGTRVKLEAVKTGLENHKVEANTAFKQIDFTLCKQQKMLTGLGEATTGMKVSQAQSEATFRMIDTTLREQQKTLIHLHKATTGMEVSQRHVEAALKELKVEVKELRGP